MIRKSFEKNSYTKSFSRSAILKLDPQGDDVPPGISLRRRPSHADRENS
jgi:hypothetical protein